jgi:hypothetical protein
MPPSARRILEGWEELKTLIPPTASLEAVEEMRRIFFAGAGTCFQAIIEETRQMTAEQMQGVIGSIEYELQQHVSEMLRKRVIN